MSFPFQTTQPNSIKIFLRLLLKIFEDILRYFIATPWFCISEAVFNVTPYTAETA